MADANALADCEVPMSRHAQGAQPADFDPAAYPILARHFFAVGPLVPIGQVLPAVFANLPRTMAANTNSPRNQRDKDMTEQELDSLKTVIRHLWREEQKDFEKREVNNGGAPDDHIFSHLETLRRYLAHERAADGRQHVAAKQVPKKRGDGPLSEPHLRQ